MPAAGAQRILIVEDEHIIALDLRSALEELGYHVVGIAASGEDALARAAESCPELALMDIRIRGSVDGIQTATLLKQRYELPVIYLTANADQLTLRRALETDPAGYLAKPYNARTLHTTIQVALRRHAAEQALKVANTQDRRRYEQSSSELLALAERLRLEANTDSLTQLYNRRYLDEVLSEQVRHSEREGCAFGVILLDVDHFKRVNDTHGHLAGDATLRALGGFLLRHLRGRDMAFRYGGEEIAILAPGASLSHTIGLAERLRAGITALLVEVEGAVRVSITASFGVAAFPEHGLDAELLLGAADDALYGAKLAGRNRVQPAAV